MVGRVVPWLSWDEWKACKAFLFSEDAEEKERGVALVECWRTRGRVPVSVDATASVVHVMWLDSREDANTRTTASDYALRMQYSMSLVRLVNGVADSQQHGKVAMAVDSLARNAGLPPLLVEQRHLATHQQLPPLPVLRLAARQAMKWLRETYWDNQETHLTKSRRRVREALRELHAEHGTGPRARGASAQESGGEEGTASETEEEDDDQDDADPRQREASLPPGSGKKERRKRRDLALGRVKACVAPHAIEDELVPVLLSTLRPPAALCGWDAPAVGPVHGGGGAGVTGLEQGSPEEQWRRAVEALCKTYSHLPVVLAMAGCRGLLEGAGGDVGESIAWLRFGLEALSGRDGGLTSDEHHRPTRAWLTVHSVPQAQIVHLEAMAARCLTPSAKRGSLTPADGNDSLPGPADAADLAAAAGLILRCASSKPSARVSSTAALLQRVVELGAPPEDLPSHSEGPATARGLPQKAVADAAVRLDVLERGLEAAASAAEAIRDSLGSGRGVGGSTCKGGRGKFRRAEGWLPCAVGSLPDALRLSGRVPDLTEAASRPAGRGCAGERGGTQGGDAGTHLGREVEGVGVEEGEGWRAEEESPGMDVDIDDEHEGWEGALAGTGERGVMQGVVVGEEVLDWADEGTWEKVWTAVQQAKTAMAI